MNVLKEDTDYTVLLRMCLFNPGNPHDPCPMNYTLNLIVTCFRGSCG